MPGGQFKCRFKFLLPRIRRLTGPCIDQIEAIAIKCFRRDINGLTGFVDIMLPAEKFEVIIIKRANPLMDTRLIPAARKAANFSASTEVGFASSVIFGIRREGPTLRNPVDHLPGHIRLHQGRCAPAKKDGGHRPPRRAGGVIINFL